MDKDVCLSCCQEFTPHSPKVVQHRPSLEYQDVAGKGEGGGASADVMMMSETRDKY